MGMGMGEAARLRAVEADVQALYKLATGGVDVSELLARLESIESRLIAIESRPRPGRKPKAKE